MSTSPCKAHHLCAAATFSINQWKTKIILFLQWNTAHRPSCEWSCRPRRRHPPCYVLKTVNTNLNRILKALKDKPNQQLVCANVNVQYVQEYVTHMHQCMCVWCCLNMHVQWHVRYLTQNMLHAVICVITVSHVCTLWVHEQQWGWSCSTHCTQHSHNFNVSTFVVCGWWRHYKCTCLLQRNEGWPALQFSNELEVKI